MYYQNICPNCKKELQEYEMQRMFCFSCSTRFSEKDLIKDEEKNLKEQQEKEKQIMIEKEKKEYAISNSDLYEYMVVAVPNDENGAVDSKGITQVLNVYARQGWKLHTVYSNELGVNSSQSFGYGKNSTICEDVLVLERKVKGN